MEKKNQIYLSAFIMYLIVGIAGYINQITNYWLICIAVILIGAFTFTCTLGQSKEEMKETSIEWISVYAFAGLEIVLTVLFEIVKLPITGFVKYFSHTIQILGGLFAIYSVVKFIIGFSHINELIGEKIAKRKKSKLEKFSQPTTNDFSNKVNETIATETTIQNDNMETNNIEIVSETKNEHEIIGIEYKTQKHVDTPYMEEEI